MLTMRCCFADIGACGTLAFAAPECVYHAMTPKDRKVADASVANVRSVTPAMDVFSLGILMLEAQTGKLALGSYMEQRDKYMRLLVSGELRQPQVRPHAMLLKVRCFGCLIGQRARFCVRRCHVQCCIFHLCSGLAAIDACCSVLRHGVQGCL